MTHSLLLRSTIASTRVGVGIGSSVARLTLPHARRCIHSTALARAPSADSLSSSSSPSSSSITTSKPPTTSAPPTSKVETRFVRSDDNRHEPGWAMHHATYTEADMDGVRVVHKELGGLGDRVAWLMVRVMRYVFDVATRYPKHRERFPRVAGSDQHRVKVGLPKYEADAKAQASANANATAAKDTDKTATATTATTTKAALPAIAASSDLPEEMELGEMRRRHLCFGPDDWLTRIVFLESVAGVPGMVASTLRHLHSLRLLRRDKGWINTLLADAANERQHLLVALKLYEPGVVMRALLLVTQGIFWNFFFLFYLVAPRVAHRFVGVLEEEAVVTYSRIIDDIRQGRLPEWEHHPAPQIAIDYWGLNKDARLLDVMRALRADEANHRFVNHTLAELQADDFSPFAYGDAKPSERGAQWGLTRDEAIAYFEREDAARRQLLIKEERKDAEEAKSPSETKSDKVFPGRQGVPV